MCVMLRHLVTSGLVALAVGCVTPPVEAPRPPDAPVDEAPDTFAELLASDAPAALVDAFLADRALPLVEDGAVVFVHRSTAASVLVAGDFDGWSGSDTALVDGTDVRWLRVAL